MITILTALMVPAAGGIVEVVISIGALTGVPLYGPPIWALFSKRLTAFSIYCTTIVSLVVNLFFKFLAPVVMGVSLDRTQEMVLGVSLPLLLLIIFEVWYAIRGQKSVQVYRLPELTPDDNDMGAVKNKLAVRVIAITLLCTGAMILVLGIIASSGKLPVILVSLIILVFSGYLLRRGYSNR